MSGCLSSGWSGSRGQSSEKLLLCCHCVGSGLELEGSGLGLGLGLVRGEVGGGGSTGEGGWCSGSGSFLFFGWS